MGSIFELELGLLSKLKLGEKLELAGTNFAETRKYSNSKCQNFELETSLLELNNATSKIAEYSFFAKS